MTRVSRNIGRRETIHDRVYGNHGKRIRDIEIALLDEEITFPPGLIAGQTSVDFAYRIPGSLLWLYRLGENFSPGLSVPNACLDTSAYDATPRNLTYKENQAGSDWVIGNRATPHTLDHTGLLDGDDGCVKFNYDGFFGSPADAGGSWLESTITGLATFNSGLKSTAGWFKANPAAANNGVGLMYGTYNGTPGGTAHGWGVFWEFGDDHLVVEIGTAVVLSLSGMSRGTWYHSAITYDAGGDLFTLYLNAVAVATWSGSGNLGSGSARLAIGGGVTRVDTSGYADFFLGEVDDVAGFSTTLTRDQVAALYLGKGAGTTSTVSTATVGTGDPVTNPGAISSVDSSTGLPVAAHEMVASKGDGTTQWEWPTHGVYVSGA